MQGTFLFLGCGASLGTPVIACRCPVCGSKDPKNQRMRPSGLLDIQGRKILIDAGPDFRSQALRSSVTALDGVLFTHAHYDHIGGVDDLRVFPYFQKKPLPCLLSLETQKEIQERFHYLFRPAEEEHSDAAAELAFHVLHKEEEENEFLGIKVISFSYFQGKAKVTGFRIGNFAYVTDIKEYGENVLAVLQGVEVLVLSSLHKQTTPVHFGLKEAIAFAEKIHCKTTYLTHLSHEIDYRTVELELPKGVHLAYDGLSFLFSI